jgi:hypothetical protein
MNTYPALFELAGNLDDNWISRKGVDWQEAEDLMAESSKMDAADRGELQAILDYADEEDDWDSEEVAGWPAQIMEYLDCGDKHYIYRSDGENWEVVGVHPSGTEDWVGTVSTETAAEGFIGFLNGNARVAVSDTLSEEDSVVWAASRIVRHAELMTSKSKAVMMAANYAVEFKKETGKELHRSAVENALMAQASALTVG